MNDSQRVQEILNRLRERGVILDVKGDVRSEGKYIVDAQEEQGLAILAAKVDQLQEAVEALAAKLGSE